MELFEALAWTTRPGHTHPKGWEVSPSAEQSQKTRFQLKSSARTSRHFRIPSPSPPRLRSSLIIISKSPARLSWTNLIINNDQDQPPSWPVLAPRPRTPDNDATRWRWPGAGAASPSRKSSGCDGTDDGGSCRQCSHFSCSAAMWELRRVKIDGAASRLRTRDPVTDGFPHLLKILCGNLSFDLKWWISAQTAIIIQ